MHHLLFALLLDPYVGKVVTFKRGTTDDEPSQGSLSRYVAEPRSQQRGTITITDDGVPTVFGGIDPMEIITLVLTEEGHFLEFSNGDSLTLTRFD